MSTLRLCALCATTLNTRPFWDNLRVHKDCFDAVLEKVTVGAAGEVKIKEEVK